MSATPARDALADMLHDEWSDTPSGWHVKGLDAANKVSIYDIVARLAIHVVTNPDLVLAALIESGWTPTDDDLRAMGGTPDRDGEWLPAAWWRFRRGTDG